MDTQGEAKKVVHATTGRGSTRSSTKKEKRKPLLRREKGTGKRKSLTNYEKGRKILEGEKSRTVPSPPVERRRKSLVQRGVPEKKGSLTGSKELPSCSGRTVQYKRNPQGDLGR